MSSAAYTKDAPFQAPSGKEISEMDREQKERRGGVPPAEGEAARGGSRPGVPRRMLGETGDE